MHILILRLVYYSITSDSGVRLSIVVRKGTCMLQTRGESSATEKEGRGKGVAEKKQKKPSM